MKKTEFPSVYRYSAEDAGRCDELALWRASFRENIHCSRAIEDAIAQSFDGMTLNDSCVNDILEQFGYKRTMWVLANTIRLKSNDGRFSRSNRDWSREIHIPLDKDGFGEGRRQEFVVSSHPAVLNGFVDLVREQYRKLFLFTEEHCAGEIGDYAGQVLIMRPDRMKESYWEPKFQLCFAHSGFGCSPTAAGRAVYATCLADGENARWERSDFIGVLESEYLPAWAAEKVQKLVDQRSSHQMNMA